jgi:small subunit ribosomal protein S1
LFIELEEGIDGLVHVSDLSWTKKIKHPSEFVKVGDELEVQVLELDVDNRRLALGHKQLEENPWDTFETVFNRGSIHKCTIISKNDKGAVLELPYGLEGIATIRNLEKEDGSSANVGETLEFRVTEFSKEDKRIVLSHTATFREEKNKTPKKKPGGTRSTVSKINQDIQKDTLGDLEALSALKEQMEGDKKAASKKVKAEEPVSEVAEEKAKVSPKEEVAPEEVKAEAKAEEVKEEKAEATEEESEDKPKKKAAPKAKKEEDTEAEASEETTEEDK